MKLGAVALVLMQFSSPLYAGEKENKIINLAVAAYGGEKLINLKSLKYTDNMHHFFEMQSGHALQGPMTTQLNNYQIETTMDFANNRKAFKRAETRVVGNHGSQGVTTTHRIFTEDKGYTVDHCLQGYKPSSRINYNNADLGYGQMLDTLIIKELNDNKDKSQWVDSAVIQGQPHDVLVVNQGAKAEYTLFINQISGLLTRMLKKRGQSLRSYDFLDHQQAQAISWAKQMFVGTENEAVYHTNDRHLSFNIELANTFNIPTHYSLLKNSKAFDVSQLTIRELAKGVYFVGQDWGYSLFIDAGDHYISAGAWYFENNSDIWQKALSLLHKTTGNNKPVSQHVVTHHHTDHMAALKSIVDLGVNLVIHPTNISSVRKHLTQSVADNQFMQVEGGASLANNKIMLIDVPTSHASHNLALYLPEHKIVFTEDIFGSSYETDLESPNSWPSLDTYQRLNVLTKKMNELGLDVEQYVSSHHGRILSQEDIDKALTMGCPAKETLTNRLFSKVK